MYSACHKNDSKFTSFLDENPDGHEGGIRMSQVPYLSHHSNFQAATRAISAALSGSDEHEGAYSENQHENMAGNIPEAEVPTTEKGHVQEMENTDTVLEVSAEEHEKKETPAEGNVNDTVNRTKDNKGTTDSNAESDVAGGSLVADENEANTERLKRLVGYISIASKDVTVYTLFLSEPVKLRLRLAVFNFSKHLRLISSKSILKVLGVKAV